MLKKHSIFKKLIFNMLPVSIIPFLLVLILVFRYTCAELRNEHTSMLSDKMDEYITSIETEKSNAILKSEYIIGNSEIRDWFEDGSTELYYQLLHIEKIKNYIQIINGGSNDTIMIYSDNPNILTSRFTDKLYELENAEEIRQKLRSTNYMYFDDKLRYDDYDKAYLTLYRQIMADTEIIIEIRAYIPRQEGFVITEKNDKYLDKDTYISAPVTDKIIAVATLNTSALKAQYLRYGLVFILIGLLFCAIIICATIVITSKTTNTINGYILRLSKQSTSERSIEEGSPHDSWELKVIKKTINELIAGIREKSDAQYRTELEKKRLELNLLQSKIDPHVLYNSLGVISHKAFKDNNKELSKLVKNLTDYYRLVLAKGRDFTTIADEVKLIAKFVSVNEISHSQKYEFIADIEPGLEDEKILHLALQPFVENSIVHGLAGKKQECIIKLTCRREGNNVIFKIYDNGYGITEDKLSELNNLASSGESYGIKNTYDRLKLFCGDECIISFQSEAGSFTEVTIVIPMQS